MSIRDVVVLTVVLGSAPICLFSPYYGILVWTWIAYFNPHRFAWGVAYTFPVAQVIAIPTLIGALFTRNINRHFLTRESVLLLLLWLWFAITMFVALQNPAFSGHFSDLSEQMKDVSKILLMSMLTLLLLTSEKRMKYLVLVTALSFGVVAAKGAVFGFRTGGEWRVYGPADSFIADNNDLALALDMSLPMLFYLARVETERWKRIGLWVVFFSGIVSVVLTYSRGGLLGLAVVLAAIAIKARKKALAIACIAILGLGTLAYAPEKWTERMNNLAEGKLDDSARSRLITWRFALNFVKDYPITGGGFGVFPDEAIFAKYTPEPLPGGRQQIGPHSSYFQVLGEHGFVGLALFLSLLGSSLWRLSSLARRARRRAETAWMVPYCDMFQVGLLGYAISGAFLGRAYFDLYFQIISCTCALAILYRKESLLVREAETSPTAVEAEPASEVLTV